MRGVYEVKRALAQSALVTKLFSLVWGRRLLNEGDQVIDVSSWRSALIRQRCGVVRRVSACFWWFK